MLIKLAIRNIFRQKIRSVITLSTIVFGCVALMFIAGFFDNMYYQMREDYIGVYTGHLQVYKNGYFKNGRTTPYQYLIDNTAEIEQLLRTIPEIKYVTKRLIFPGLLAFADTSVSAIFLGVEPEYEKNLDAHLSRNPKEVSEVDHFGSVFIDSGAGLKANDEYQMVMGRGLGNGVEAKIGQAVVLVTSTIKGSTNALDMQVKGMFFSASKDLDDILIRVPLKTAQKLLDTQSVQSLVIQLKKTEDTVPVKLKLSKLFQEHQMDLEMRTWRELYDDYDKTVKIFNSFYEIIRCVVGIIVVFGIFNIINMSVLERMTEIGTLRALGMNDFGIRQLFMTEGMMIGLIGGGIGVLSGAVVIGLISLIGMTIPPFPGMTFSWMSRPSLVFSEMLWIFILSVLLGAFSAIFPAWRASRLQIVAALRAR